MMRVLEADVCGKYASSMFNDRHSRRHSLLYVTAAYASSMFNDRHSRRHSLLYVTAAYASSMFNDRHSQSRGIAELQLRLHRPKKYKGPFSVDCRERGSHARGVYPTRDTSRMGTAR